jgi:DNA-binding beta-propeller fold protein YncE
MCSPFHDRHGPLFTAVLAIALALPAAAGTSRTPAAGADGQYSTYRDWVSISEIPRPAYLPSEADRSLTPQHISSGQDPECDMPTNVVFSPDGLRFLITHEATGNVAVYDSATLAALDVIPVSGHPYNIAAVPGSTLAVTANLWEDTASIIDYDSAAEVGVVPVGQRPSMVLVSPDGTYAVIGNALDETWTVIDIDSQSVVRTVDAGGAFGFGFAGGQGGVYSWTYPSVVLPDNRLVLQDFVNEQINFVDLATGAVTSVPVDPNGMFITATPDGARVVVLHNPVPDPLFITVIDTASETVEHVISAPSQSLYQGATNMVMRPDGTRIAFFHGATAVMIFDITDPQVPPIQSFWYGNGLETTADGAYLFLNRSRCSSLLDWETGQPLSFGGPPEFCAPEEMVFYGSEMTACSPIENRLVMLSVFDQENVVMFSLDGVDAFVEGVESTGPSVEADRCRNMVVSTDGTRAIAISEYTSNATLFDLETSSVIGWVDVGAEPRGLVLTPDGSRALVTNTGDGTVTEIDLGTLETTTIDVGGCAGPIAVDPSGQWAYFSNVVELARDTEGRLGRIDLATLEPDPIMLTTAASGMIDQRTIGLFLDMTWTKPQDLVISHDATLMCVCGSDAVSIVDLDGWTEVERIELTGTMPLAACAAFAPGDDQLYVVHYDIWVMDESYLNIVPLEGARDGRLDPLVVGVKAAEVVLNDAGTRMYIACRGAGSAETKAVVVVDPLVPEIITTIPMPDPENTTFQRPVDIVLSRDESTLFAVTTDGYLHTIDTASNTILDSQDIDGVSSAGFDLNRITGRATVVSPHAYVDGLVVFGLDACAVDLTADGTVNVFDLLMLLDAWGEIGGPADVNDDGTVDVFDLLLLLANWGPCGEG